MAMELNRRHYLLFIIIICVGLCFLYQKLTLAPNVLSMYPYMVPLPAHNQSKLTVGHNIGNIRDICPLWHPDDHFFPTSEQILDMNATAPNITLKSFISVTSVINSTIEIINPQESYHICDRVAVRIVARSDDGTMKSYGGDYLRSKIVTTKPYSASGPDYFFDYHNGTYVALFTLRWEGTVNIEVMLVHPSEAIPVLKRTTIGGKGGNLFTFLGTFEATVNGKKHKEDVVCGVSDFQTPSCNNSATDTHGPWFCKRPRNPHLTCNDWTYHHMDKASSMRLEKSLSSVEKLVFKRTKVKMKTLIQPFEVTSSSDDIFASLPVCGTRHVPLRIETNGYFHNNLWQPFDCKLKLFRGNNISSCLEGKSLYMFGDSTARQMYMYVKEHIICANKEEFLCSNVNTTIHFTYHGLPIKIGLLAKNIRYVAQEIDNLQGGPGVFILLSVWAHFGLPEESFYRQRLLAIKGAIERLLKRSPETTVIIRSANTRGHSIGGFILISSDWIALQGEQTLRNVFAYDSRLQFMDVWDMTLVQKSKDDIHPLTPTLEQIMDYMLTLLCHG